MLQHVRYHIVAVHVSGEIQDSFKDLVEDGSNLIFLTVLEHTLDDTAAELMHTHFIDTGAEGIDNELDLV